MERDAALASEVAAERSLEVFAELTTERDSEYTTAKRLAAALAEDYLAAERALRMATEAGVREGSGGRSAQPIQPSNTGQPVPEQGYRNQTPPCRSSCRRKTACGCPSFFMGVASCIRGQADYKLSGRRAV